MKTKIGVIITLLLFIGITSLTVAQTQTIVLDVTHIELVGSPGETAASRTFRLTAQEDVGGLSLLVSDLTPISSTTLLLDAIPANSISFSPASEWAEIAVGESIQVVLSAPPSTQVGRWQGQLTLRWQTPEPTEIEIPITLFIRNEPAIQVISLEALRVTGLQGQRVQRTILLQETSHGSPATDLHFHKQDLVNATGDSILPANNIDIALPQISLSGGDFLETDIMIRLANVPSGEYNGTLLISDDYNALISIPISVTIKDSPIWPILVLFLGVALGTGISTYRQKGRPRDKLLVEMTRLRRWVGQEEKASSVLKRPIEAILLEAETALSTGTWEVANEAIARANKLVLRWRQNRSDWIAQIERIDILEDRLNTLDNQDSNLTLVKDLHLKLNRLELDDYETPNDLSIPITEAEQIFNSLEPLTERLHYIQEAYQTLPNSLQQNWYQRVQDLERTLQRLSIDDKNGATNLAGQLSEEGKELKNVVQEANSLSNQKHSCLGEARTMMDELSQNNTPDNTMPRTVEAVIARINQEDSPQSSQWAENVWRGLWSVKYILPLASPESDEIIEATKTLRYWLNDGNVYLQPTKDFRASLKEKEAALQAAITKQIPDTAWPPEPAVPQVATKGALIDLSGLDRDITLRLDANYSSVSATTLVPEAKSRGRIRQLWLWVWSPEGRLGTFKAISYIITLLFLAGSGFNELYNTNPTFGADGLGDYFALLAWGFGAEATRSAVTELVKGLNNN